ncbi:MAG: Rossmann-like and DUF2520 domain-containing protein [Gaiellaceae bacterium]
MELEPEIEPITIVGAGRVGSALAARLRERGLAVRISGRELDIAGATLVVLCVPDRAIAETAARIEPGPWIAHTSGATPLTVLSPHARRFSVHPLQTFTRTRGPEQLDGAWAAVTAEDDEARRAGFWLAQTLGLEPFDLDDSERVLYHAGAVVASNYLVTLHRAAAELVAAAGAPAGALVPLMRRVVDNGFELTGPIARGDWATVESHLEEIRARSPELEPLYRTLADATEAIAR